MDKKIAVIGIVILIAGIFAFTKLRGQQEAPATSGSTLVIEDATAQAAPARPEADGGSQEAAETGTPSLDLSALTAPALSFADSAKIDTDALAEQAKDALNSMKEEASALVEQALADAKEQAQALGGQVQEQVQAISEQAQDQVQQALETAKAETATIAEQTLSSIGATQEEVAAITGQAQEQVQEAVKAAKEQADAAIAEQKGAATAAFGSALSSLSGKTGGLASTLAKRVLDENGSYSSKDDVALYLYLYGHLPQNFITKTEARKLGWTGGGLDAYAPGKSIGGDSFGNRERLLPARSGRTYTECDIDTKGKSSRGAKRIVFSSDGLIYYTGDHYETFELLYDRSK